MAIRHLSGGEPLRRVHPNFTQLQPFVPCCTPMIPRLKTPITGRSGPNFSFPKPAVDGGEATVTTRDNEGSTTRGIDDLLRVFGRLQEHRGLAAPFA